MALNIKQLTNFSKIVEDTPVGDDNYIELDLGRVVKFGYICEMKGIIHPIYLKIDGEYVYDEFHSRYSAQKKEYHYKLSTNEYSPFDTNYISFHFVFHKITPLFTSVGQKPPGLRPLNRHFLPEGW